MFDERRRFFCRVIFLLMFFFFVDEGVVVVVILVDYVGHGYVYKRRFDVVAPGLDGIFL